ncbi:RANBP2-like and GRIP domain-containing 2 isoform X2, partial [Paramuricea clavata]
GKIPSCNITNIRISFAINNDQSDVLLKIVKLYTELKIDPEIAKAWADHASKRIPGHPAIFDLQVHLIELKRPFDYDELINLIAEELTQRPHDGCVHAKLVETYMEMDHVDDAYDHCVSVNKTKAFHKNVSWFVLTVGVLERYLNLRERQVKNHSPMSRQSILQEIYIALLTSYCNMVELNLTHSTLRKSSTSLLRSGACTDGVYGTRIMSDGFNKSSRTICGYQIEASEWDVAVTEIRAQLYMLSGHLLLRLAKEGYSAWSQALEMATACYVTSYRVSEPEMTSPWVAKATSERNPVMWSIMAASRLSQTGHLILSTLDRYGEEKINSILLNLCSPQGQEDILTTLYGHNNDFSKLFLSEDESFLTPEFFMPEQLMKYDEVFIAENPLNLELIVWIGLQWYQHGQETEPGIEILVSQLFEGLRMDVHDIAQCVADFVCLRDVEAFIYAVIKCSAHGIFEDLDVVYEYYQPKLLPLCLCPSLCIPTQTDWWNAVYTLFTGTVSVSSSGRVKMTVQRGLEQIRTLKNQGMHPKLVIHLATNFGQKSLLLKDAAGYSQWYYSTHWKSFQLRSLHYWNVALSLFEDMKRNKNPGCPKDPLFPHNLNHLEDHDIHRYFREACMTLGEAAVERGDLEHALNLFSRVESSHAAWNEAQIFKHLAGLESRNADVDDRAYESLEYDKVVRDAVEEELAAIESLMNERKSFYHVDPRKSIDFHQLDFDALKSPVCSDITESGETMPLKENDTRELLATVSEVTLDNGFLREQVSIRDEQVLRLSRQVQELQGKLARYKEVGDTSSVSFSCPSERTPSPLDESPAVHLETGEKFTRQGTFINNIVVPTDRYNDPSFFSGLSNSNTPDRIQTVLDGEQEDESEEETDGEDIYFEPVVQLPSQVEFRSGEEDETVIFEERAKLFRFQDGEWKERGLGNLKLLWNNTTGQARILMRREKVLKICANHFLTQDMTLKAGKGSDRSWVWTTLADISDDETKPEQFAAKFQTKEIAEKFKATFEELQQKKASFVPESPAVSPFAANPLATKPTPDHMQVPMLSSNLPYLSSTPNKPAGAVMFTKSGLQPFADSGQSTTSSAETPFPSATIAGTSPKSSGVADAANFWNQPHMFPASPNMPYFQSYKDNSKEPLPFQAPHLGSEQPLASAAFQSNGLSSSLHPQNAFSFSFGNKPEASVSLGNEQISSTPNAVSKNEDENGSTNGVIFRGTSEKSSLSFQDLVSNNAFTSPGTSGTGFTGFGKPIFSVPDNEREEENDIENEANIDFKPIVSLPLVKNQTTGEEGELTRFSERAKLFRFDPASKEWKERGLGEIKLLYDPSSGRSRVVMRREQVHKLCANHFVHPSMKLKANTTSNRSWLWYTHADVSDGEPKAEQLAVKFKLEKTASEFKKVFEELQSISPTSKASDPDADQDTSTTMSVAPSSQSTGPQFNNDLKLQFQPPAGSWPCDTCLVQNSPQTTQCVACQTPKPGFSKQTRQPTFSFVPPSSFSFGSPASGGKATTTSQANDSEKPAFNSGFTFGSPNFSFGLQAPKDKAPESDTSQSSPNSGFLFGSGKTLLNESTFGEQKAYKPPFAFPKSDNDASQRSTSNALPFQIPPTSQDTNNENNKFGPTVTPVKETSLKDLLTQPSLPGNDLKLAFQPAEGSWECDTCLVRNTPESNVCVACQTTRSGTQPTVTNPGFNFNTGTTSGFSFGAGDTSKAPSAGTGFNFGSGDGSKDSVKETGFSFGGSDVTKAPAVTNNLKLAFQPAEGSWECDTCLVRNVPESSACVACQSPKSGTQPAVSHTAPNTDTPFGFSFCPREPTEGSGFSFGPSDTSKLSSAGTGFTFAPADKTEDQNSGTGFTFGPNKDQSSGTGFTFGPKDGNLGKGPNFSFNPSGANKDSTKETGFSFGPSDASKDSNKTTFDPNTTNKDSDKEPPSLSTDSANIGQRRTTSFDDGDTDSEETTESDSDSEASEEYSINSHEASREDSFLKLPTPGSTSLSEKDLQLILKHPVGSWECETCLIQNTADVVRCVACEASKPSAGLSGDSSSGKEADSTGSTFQDNSSYPGNDDLKQKFQAPEGSWDCDVCMVRNNKQSHSCAACQTPKPGQTKQSLDSNIFGQSFPNRGGFSHSATTESTPSAGFTFGKPLSGGFMFENDPKDSQAFGFNFSAPTNEKAGSSGFNFGSTPQTEETGKSGPIFGDSKGESSKPVFSFGDLGNANKGFTFGSIASDQSGFNFGDVQTNQPGFHFSNSGDDTSGDGVHLETKKPIDKSIVTKKGEVDSKDLPKLGDAANLLSQGAFTFHLDIPKEPTMTSASNKDLNKDNPEAEDEGVAFKPIVSLPSRVDVKTGEEGETTLFSSHAKLYRFTQSTWKERGVGEMKILYDPTGKRGRIIMRRDQVHILCANHFISKDMKLQPQGSSNKSWLWHVQGDFADNEAKEQLFAVKFGDKDTALAFKRAFEECLDNKVRLLNEGVLDDEVIVVYEVSVTEEQRARAAKFLLPPNFYAYENQNEDVPGEKQDIQETLSVVPAKPAPQSFVFGSAGITSLSFNALASSLGSSPAFSKSSPNKDFTGAGSQLFVQDNNQEDDDPEREVSGIDFKPIVQLEKIEQSSGEENEINIYTQRTKLYRYDKDTAQWKERGVGNLKLLKHKITGQVRVLMRRDQIFKVCANHFLTADMELKANAGSDRSWVWHTNADISDGEPKAEQLAVRFKNAEIAQEFKDKFDMCKEELASSTASGGRNEDVKEHNFSVDATVSNDALDTILKTQEDKSASPGNVDSTTDDTLDNKGTPRNVGDNEEEQREASQSPGETSSTLDDEQTSDRKQLVAGLKSLPLSSSSKTPSKDSPPEQAKGSSSSQRKTRTSSSSAKSFSREILSNIDQPSPSTEPVMRVNFNFHSIVAGKAIYTGLKEEKVNPPDTNKDADKTEIVKELFPDTEDKNIGKTERAVENEEPEGDAESSSVVDGGGPVFTFGSGDISTLSFASLANQSCGFTSQPNENKGFVGGGGQLFSSNDEDDPEREVEGTDFKPIVSLPDIVEQKTGEEDETVVYTHRAKLYRYDLDTKQWKERGVGDIKILLHNETKRCRVVMRRAQIHKLCANHYMTAGMELKENEGSDRSWVWSVDADFSDGVAKNELLAVRFKHREDAVMFRDKFIECQKKKEIKASESTSIEERPSNEVDEVVIVFEKVPSPEQKEQAQLYKLPETFYCFEQDSGDEVETSSDEDDAVDVTTQSQESVPEKDDSSPENEETTPIFQFGSKETSTLSFSELAQQTSGFPTTREGTWKGFLGGGGQLFSSNDEDDPEREVEGTDFKPIVSLPDIAEQKTGEEDETVVYTHRAKLFRYDFDTKQWKERGVGDIKILLHNETKRCRVVMRREQIHKLCANHYITAGMELKENEGSDRSWVWSVDADFADGGQKNELLAVRFKHREDAVMFRDKFIGCQEKNEIKANESTSVEEKLSDDVDEVVIIFEKVPSPEQKERAQLYELPETFYCFEQDLGDEVETSSDEDDAVDVTTQSQESVPEKDDSSLENEENTPIFQFGSKETSTLSFAELAEQTSGFPTTSEGTWKGFLGGGGQLFSSNDEDDPEREVEGADFKPIVSLPDIVEQKTGEEDETVVYTHRAKLYRYDSDTKQWKERGVGDIKILLHNETKRCRVVMRREQIHKLCANHYITAGMELKENEGSDRSWVWSVDADFSDGVAKNELLAVRFKHREDALMFRDKFIECQDKNEIKASESTSVEEKPSNDVDEVVIVFEKVPSPKQKEQAQLYELPQTFYCSEEAANVKLVEGDIQEKSKEKGAGNVSESFQDKEEDRGYSDDESSVQSQDFITPPESYPEGAESASQPRYKLNVVDESPSDVPDDSILTLQDSSSTTTYAHSFVFGSQDISSLSFSALAGKTAGFKSSPNKEFTGAGSQLFVQENTQEDDDPEREVSSIDFKPIVQLEKIEQSSGEENEINIYTQRTKLYRYDKDTAQWKERGVGNLKLLKHKITGQVRVLMRRDQIFKVCANHFLTADMELKANAGSDRSWVWHTNADISDGEPKAEQLAVRFKNAEIAQEFKDKFDMCKEELKNIQRKDDDNADEKQR